MVKKMYLIIFLFLVSQNIWALKVDFTSWGIEKNSASSIDVPSRLEKVKKKNIIVAIIDSGIDFNHEILKNNIYVPQKHPLLPLKFQNKKLSKDFYGFDFSKKEMTSTPIDNHGHGTHIAGIIKSVYSDAQFLILKYFDPALSGEANLQASLQALNFAVNCDEVDIINISGGGQGSSAQEKALIEIAKKKGKLVIVAAGNEKLDIDNAKNSFYPASYNLDNIISVNAYDQNLELIGQSSWGKKTVHISAPGQRIKSTMKGNSLAYLAGTSQATAFVSGVAALIKSIYPQATYQLIKEAIIKSADKIASLENKTVSGGKLNASKSLAYVANVLNPPILNRTIAQAHIAGKK